MDVVFAFKALSYVLVGLLVITVFALSLVSLTREIHSGRPLAGLVHFAVIIAGFCVVVALFTAYVRFQRAASMTLRLDRVALTIQRSAVEKTCALTQRQAL